MSRATPWRYYAFKTFCNLTFFDAIFFPYFLRDLAPGQVWTLLSAGTVGMLLFEVPAGAIADAFGRKTSFITGLIIQAAALLLLVSPVPFAVLILAEVLFGAGFALVSGADTAFLYDYLQTSGQSRTYKTREGTAWALSWLAIALSNVASPLLFAVWPPLPFALTAGALLGAATVGITLRESRDVSLAARPSPFRTLCRGFAVLRQNSSVGWYVLFYGLMMAFLGTACVFR